MYMWNKKLHEAIHEKTMNKQQFTQLNVERIMKWAIKKNICLCAQDIKWKNKMAWLNGRKTKKSGRKQTEGQHTKQKNP